MVEAAPRPVDTQSKVRKKSRANGHVNGYANGSARAPELRTLAPVVQVSGDFLERDVTLLLQEGDAAMHLQNKMQLDVLTPENFPDLPDGVLALHRFHARNILANNFDAAAGIAANDPELQALVQMKAEALRREGNAELKGVLLGEFPAPHPEPELQSPSPDAQPFTPRVNSLPASEQNMLDLITSQGWTGQLHAGNFPWIASLSQEEFLTLFYDAVQNRKNRLHQIAGSRIEFPTPERDMREEQAEVSDPDYSI